MTDLTLRPMTGDELDAFYKHQSDGYVRQMVEFGGMREQVAVAKGRSSMDRLWPGARPGEDQYVFAAELGGTVVGSLWLSTRSPSGIAGQGWVADVEVEPSQRGRGLGRAIMLAALEQARSLGCTELALNVFGGNDVAIRLYQSMGFRTTALQMTKPRLAPTR